jgi:hypothetical protein
MTSLDRQDIKELFHFERYNKTSIGKLYGVSKQRIAEILAETNTTFGTDASCIFKDENEATVYYIDGDEDNQKPQNKIQLCIVHRKKFEHRQLNKRVAEAKAKYQS